MRRLVAFTIAAITVLTLGACGDDDEVTAETSGDEEEQENVGPLQLLSANVGPFVREIRGGCTEGEDSCESRGDCEAAPVDCGEEPERLRITAHWATSDDVDLYVTDRNGDTLSFLRPRGMSGGRMIVPPGRTCLPDRMIGDEIAAYTGGDVLIGAYRVVLQHFGSCMSGSGTVDVDLTISAAGRHLRSFRATLAPRDRIEVLTLDVGESGDSSDSSDSSD